MPMSPQVRPPTAGLHICSSPIGESPPRKTGWRRLWQQAPSLGQPSSASRDSDTKAAAWRDERLARIEALLFLGREPLASRRIAQLVNLADGTEARTLVRRLNRMYDESASAFRIEEVAGGFQLLTRPQFGAWLRRLFEAPPVTRLSAPALETLAVIAYRQPVLRPEIEAIRGVGCGDLLRQLMDRDLVRIVGRAGELGRPLLYGTTKRFLQIFGLRHLDELPRAEALRRPAEIGAEQTTSQTTSGMPPVETDLELTMCIHEEDAE